MIALGPRSPRRRSTRRSWRFRVAGSRRSRTRSSSRCRTSGGTLSQGYNGSSTSSRRSTTSRRWSCSIRTSRSATRLRRGVRKLPGGSGGGDHRRRRRPERPRARLVGAGPGDRGLRVGLRGQRWRHRDRGQLDQLHPGHRCPSGRRGGRDDHRALRLGGAQPALRREIDPSAHGYDIDICLQARRGGEVDRRRGPRGHPPPRARGDHDLRGLDRGPHPDRREVGGPAGRGRPQRRLEAARPARRGRGRGGEDRPRLAQHAAQRVRPQGGAVLGADRDARAPPSGC